MIRRIGNVTAFLCSFVRTRWGFKFHSRQALLAYQKRKLERFSSRVLPRAKRYRVFAGQDLAAIPVVRKDNMLAEFDSFNTLGISLPEAQALAISAEENRDFEATLPGKVTVGLSSGTSGRRSVFLASERERYVWAGTILARTLSKQTLRRLLNPFAAPVRVAFFLRANSNLYETVDGTRMKFRFFDLISPLSEHLPSLEAYAPDVLIAPASVLHRLADFQSNNGLNIHPNQVISVAEVLESDDQRAIEQAWKFPVKQIYQCTEGFLGYTCEEGKLHLNEEFVHIEPVWMDQKQDRFEAIITDFTRNTQLFVRFQMDDVLQIDRTPCACGRHSLCLVGVEGRSDDVLWLQEKDKASLIPIFPDQLRRAMLMAQERFEDYRIEQNGLTLCVRLLMRDELYIADQMVSRELSRLWKALNVVAPSLVFEKLQSLEEGAMKRRRIRCIKKPEVSLSQQDLNERLSV